MKKRFLVLLFGILILVFAATSLKGAGPIPENYGDARSLLAMLWDKLDQAIVSNYDVAMLLRYHDHGGSVGDGSLVTRGLPIGSAGIANDAITSAKISDSTVTANDLATDSVTWWEISEGAVDNFSIEDNSITADDIAADAVGSSELADNAVDSGAIASGAVTATKLSTAARTSTVSAMMGNLGAGSERWPAFFVAPTNGTVTGVSFVNGANLATNGVNYTTVSVSKQTSANPWQAGVVKSISNSSADIDAHVVYRYTTGLSYASFNVGDVYLVEKEDTGAGAATTELLVTIEYTVSE